MSHLAVYAGLFAAALLAATFVPCQSEVVLFGLLLTEHYPWWLLVLVASIGQYAGVGCQLAARPVCCAFSASTLVPCTARGAGTRTGLVQAVRPVVIASQLGSLYW
jgi:hypothetical protein